MAGIEGECYPSARTDYADSVTRVAHHNDPLAGVTRLLVDLDGVLYRGSTPVPGVAAVLARRAAAGDDVVYVTNN